LKIEEGRFKIEDLRRKIEEERWIIKDVNIRQSIQSS
jgi:hypothetical protein